MTPLNKAVNATVRSLIILFLITIPVLASAGGLKEIAFIDSAVPDAQVFEQGIKHGIEVVRLDAGRDGVVQIGDILKHRHGLHAIHLISHGAPGMVFVGTGELSAESLQAYDSQLHIIAQSLRTHGEILLYGCNVAQGSTGEHFAESLAFVTKATVAASTDATGAASRGGNWVLEKVVGSQRVAALSVPDFKGLLATPLSGVTTFGSSTYYSPTVDASGAGYVVQNIVGSGWDFRVFASSTAIDVAVNVEAFTGDTMLPYGATNSGATHLTSIQLSSNDGQLFDLSSVQVTVDGVNSTSDGSSHLIQLVGYRNGSPVVGATLAEQVINASGGGPLVTFDVSGNDSFKGIDAFRVEPTGTDYIDGAIGVDNVDATNFHTADSAPTVTNLNGDTASYTEGANPVLLDSGTDATATEDVNWNGGKLLASLAANQDFVADLLGITNQGTGVGLIGVSSSYVTYGGTTIGTMGGGKGNLPLTIIFNASATDAAVSALLRNLTFRTTNASNPSTGPRTVRVTLADSAGNISANNDITVTVTAVNNAPTFAAGSGSSVISTAPGEEMGYAAAVQPDGKILVAGNVSNVVDPATWEYDEPNLLLARYNADGSIDTSFATNGFAKLNIWTAINSAETGIAIAVLPDGKIVVGAGEPSQSNSEPQFGVARFNANGTPDTSFGTNGAASFTVGTENMATAHGMTMDSRGNILLVGESLWRSGSVYQYTTVLRVKPDGTLDTTFSGDGIATTNVGGTTDYNYASGIAVQPDGKIVVVGTRAGAYLLTVLRYNDDGTLDTSFGTSGVAQFDVASSYDGGTAVAIQSDGKIVVGGNGYNGANNDFMVLRLTGTGSLDTSFNGTGKLLLDLGGDDRLSAVTIQSDGKILLSGLSSGSTAFARLASNGTLDTSFDSDGKLVVTGGETGQGAVLQGDGRIVTVGAHLDATYTYADLAVDRLNADGSKDLSFGSDVTNTLNATPSYTQGDTPVVLDDHATVFDSELSSVSSYSGATLTLARNGGANANDLFSASGTLAALTEGGNLAVDGTIIGTVTTNSNGTLVLAFTANATETLVNSAMRQIAYSNSIGSPASVQIDWTFSDGNTGSQGTGGAKSASGSNTVSIISLNIAPTFVGATTTLTVNQNSSATDIKGLLHVSDSDSGQTETWSQSVAPNHGGTLSISGATASSGSTDITPGGTITYQPANGYSGTETFTVQVSDGTATATRQITATIVPPPTVTSVSVPANGTYKIGDALDFTVTYDATITVTGTPILSLTLNTGGTVQASYVSGSGSQNLVFRYTVASGNLDNDGITVGSLALNGGTLKNGSGIDANLTLNSVASTAGVLVDGVSPTVGSLDVPSNATYVAGQNLDFTANFSENVSVVTTGGTPYITLTIGTATVHAPYVSGTGTSALLFRYTVAGGDLDTDGITLSSNITINGGSIKDGAGNSATLTFSGSSIPGVLLDAVAPTVSSVSVPANATYVAGQNLDFTVNFSENVTVDTTGGTPTLPITLNTGGTVNASYVSGSGTSALVFRYTVVSGNADLDGIAVGASISANGGTIRDAATNNATLTLNSVGSTAAVLVDAITPTVTSVSVPANATYVTGQNLDFTVNFSENVTVTGTDSTLGLTIGISARTAVYQSKTATSITYRYTVQNGDIDTDGITVGTMTLNSTTIRDTAGNNATLTLNSIGSTAGVLIDSLVPTATAANAITFTGFNANWGAVAGATGYYLDVATDSGFTSFATSYSNNDVGNVTTIAVTGLTTGTPYYYRVRAYNTNGTSADSNTIALTTTMTRVVTTTNDSGAGSLRQITTDANPGDVITFDNSLDGQTITLAADIIIDKDVTINGPGATNLTISGGDTTRIFSVNSGKTVQISGLTLSHGKSFDGPAISNSGVLTVSNTTISGNYAQSSSGSGIYNNPGATLTVTGCTISGNTADVLGGGVYNNNGTATITNTTIADNSAMGGGGGGILNNSAGTLTVANSTISGNASGGLVNLSGGTVTIRNAIFWGSGSYISGVVTISDSIVTNGCYPGSTCTNVSSADPLLGTLGNYGGTTGTIPLLAGSPAIDAGNCTGGPATDQRGMARPQDTTCDIGAYERGVPAALTATAGTLQSTAINTSFATALAARVVDSLGGVLDGISVAFTGPGSGAGISASGNATSDASGNATYSVTANGTAGSYTVAAAVNTLSANFSLTNAKADQAIIFGTSPTVVVAATGTVSTTGGASTSPVVLSSTTTSVCTISGTTVTGVTAGTCTIAANQAGDANYNAAPQVTQDITVGKGIATVSLGNLSATYDSMPKSVTATTTPVGLTVNITYNGSATAPTTAGSYTVVATVSDTNYTGSATDTLVIAKAAATVSLGNLSATYDGTAKAATATTAPAGLTIAFTYDGATGAPTEAGSYTVAATVVDTNYSGTTTGTLTIDKAGQTITFAPLTAKTYGDADFGPGATVDTSLPITYASDTPAVATITAGGLLHISGAGSTVITASQAGDANHLPTSVQRTLTVNKALITVTANNTSREFGAPDPLFTATFTGFVNGETTAVVTGAPTFTTDATSTSPAGSYTITPVISALTAANYDFAAANGTLAVGLTSQTITFNPLAAKTYGDSQFDLSATGGASGNPVTFTSSDPAVATVSGTTVTIIGAGTTTITASQAGTSNYASATAQQTLTVNKAQITLTADNKQRAYNTPNPPFTGTYSGFVNSEDVTVISGTPTFTTTATQTSPAGSYPIMANISGLTAANYDFVAANGTLAIDVTSQTITFGPLAAKTYGDSQFDLVATGDASGNPVTFASSNPAVATVSGATVTIVGAGSTTITASQAGTTNYASATAQQGLTVNKATLTVTAQAASRAYNSAEPSFSATYSGFINGDNQSVILGAPNLSTTAILTSPVGDYPITPAIGNLAANNYLFSFVNGTLTITQATPVITWVNPSAITYGTALDATQLNATSGVAGSFVYTPPAGSVLNAGAGQTLTVTFAPADTTNYAGSTANVAIDVNKATATVTLDNLVQTFDGTARAATVTTTPANLPIVVTYNGTGTVPVTVGSYTVLATVNDANYLGSASGTLVIGKATPAITWTSPSAITYGTALDATQLNATTGVAGTLVYTPSAGTILGAGTQALNVAFTPTDGTNYGPATASVTLDVAKAPQTITFAALPTKQIGDAPFTIGATTTSGLPVTFASSNPSVATVSGTTVTIVGVGTATITASQSGDANRAAATDVAQTLTVAFNGAAPQLTVSALSDGATTTDTTQNISGTVFDLNGISSLTINGISVTINPDGSFSFPVQLVAGANTITVIATSNSGATTSDVRTITMDSTAPYLTVTYPPDNKVLIQNYVTVTGTIAELLATSGTSVAKTAAATAQAIAVTYTVNGSSPQMATLTDTDYSFTVSLDQGMNTIQVSAIDSAGKTSEAKRTLSYQPAFSLAVTDPASDIRTVLDSYLLTGTVADNTTPVTVTITIDGQNVTPAVVDGTFQQQLSLSEAKVYQVSVTGIDQNNNSLTVQRNIIKTVPKAASGSTSPFTIVDALLALKMAVGIVTPQTDQILRLDVAPLVNGVSKGDGIVDIDDALVILRMAVGLL